MNSNSFALRDLENWRNTSGFRHVLPNDIVQKIRGRGRQESQGSHFIQTKTQPYEIQRYKYQFGNLRIHIQISKCGFHFEKVGNWSQHRSTRSTNTENVKILSRHPQHKGIHHDLLTRFASNGHGLRLLFGHEGVRALSCNCRWFASLAFSGQKIRMAYALRQF